MQPSEFLADERGFGGYLLLVGLLAAQLERDQHRGDDAHGDTDGVRRALRTEPGGDVADEGGRGGAAEPAAKVVTGAGNGPRCVADAHGRAGEQGVQQSGGDAAEDDGDDDHGSRSEGHDAEKDGVEEHGEHRGADFAEAGGQARCEQDAGDGDAQAPAEEDESDGDCAVLQDEGRPGEHDEERGGVERGPERGAQQPGVFQGAQRVEHADGGAFAARAVLRQERGGEDQSDRHEHARAGEGAAPGDVAEQCAEQGAGGHAETECRFVEQDGGLLPAAGCADDHGQGGGDEEGVAQAPDGAQGDELADRAGECAQQGGGDDEGQSDDDGAFRSVPGAERAGDEHRHDLNAQVGGEQQGDLFCARVQRVGDGQHDRVDESDPCECDHGRECGDPDGLGLAFEHVEQSRAVPAAHRTLLLALRRDRNEYLVRYANFWHGGGPNPSGSALSASSGHRCRSSRQKRRKGAAPDGTAPFDARCECSGWNDQNAASSNSISELSAASTTLRRALSSGSTFLAKKRAEAILPW